MVKKYSRPKITRGVQTSARGISENLLFPLARSSPYKNCKDMRIICWVVSTRKSLKYIRNGTFEKSGFFGIQNMIMKPRRIWSLILEFLQKKKTDKEINKRTEKHNHIGRDNKWIICYIEIIVFYYSTGIYQWKIVSIIFTKRNVLLKGRLIRVMGID